MQHGKGKARKKIVIFVDTFRSPNCYLQSYFSDHGCHLSISNDIQRNPGGFSVRDNLRREDMLAVPRRNWCKPSSLSLELAMLFLISSMEICVHRLSWCSSFLAFYKQRFTSKDFWALWDLGHVYPVNSIYFFLEIKNYQVHSKCPINVSYNFYYKL